MRHGGCNALGWVELPGPVKKWSCMRPVRATLGDRFEILSTRRVTPIYRDVQARDLKRDRQVRLWIIEDRLIRENAVRQRFLDAVRAFVDAPVPGGVRLLGA